MRRSISKLITLPAERWELASTKGCILGKVLGTSAKGTTKVSFDITRWAIFAIWEDESARTRFVENSPLLERWRHSAVTLDSYMLSVVASRGTWNGVNPFNDVIAKKPEGEVAIFTRATIPLRKFWGFARAIPPVDSSLQVQPGCSLALGIGEWPIGQQSTFSVWNSMEDARRFAYKGSPHTKAIQQNRDNEWFSEAMFTRFAVTQRF